MIKSILVTDPARRYTIEDIRKHLWFSMHKEVRGEGIIVGFNTVPIDREVLKELED